jgi:DNA-binding MarR family transcriptional regulator
VTVAERAEQGGRGERSDSGGAGGPGEPGGREVQSGQDEQNGSGGQSRSGEQSQPGGQGRPGAQSRPAGQARPDDDLAEVWSRMKALVLRNDLRAEVTEALGLSFVKTRALRRLLPEPLAMRDLAAELMTDKPYVTLIVDHLEQLGLVTRGISPDDRRRRIVTLTESGRAAAERSVEILNRPPEGLTALPPEDLATLNRILGAVPGI